jgi:hypothetical protein
MRRTNPDPATDERLERLLDEALRAEAQASPVDLRAKVLGALDDGQRAPANFRLRWAFAVAAAAALVLAVFVARQAGVREGAGRVAENRPLRSAPLAAGHAIAPAAGQPDGALALAAASSRTRRATRIAWDDEPRVAEAAPDPNEPFLPGAPAGELGDPLKPLPSPPLISFTPITSAPQVSDYARPVTDFPADTQTPGVPTGTTGQSGGTRR